MLVIRATGIAVLVSLLSSLLVAGVPLGVPRPAAGAPTDPSMGRARKTAATSIVVPGRVIVKLRASELTPGARSSFGVASLDAFAARYGVQGVDRLYPRHAQGLGAKAPGGVDLGAFFELRYASPVDAFAVAEELSGQSGVEYAEPRFAYEVTDASVLTPNDTLFSKQWHLLTIRADSAWAYSQGDTSVVVSIIDTGVQWDHPDLAANIWINAGENGPDGLGGEKRTNGLDDDGNGFVDDYHGWDFGGASYTAPVGDNNPTPTSVSHTHGTHCAGIASAVTNNITGIASVGYQCRIMPVKAASDNDFRGAGGSPYIIFGFEGMVYAAERGAHVISLSWGGAGFSAYEQEIVNYVAGLGSLIVAAAGNTNTTEPQYPASYDHVVSVAATGRTDARASYTSYNRFVDLTAPGGDGSGANQIYSTYYPNTYNYISGTSMSTPLTAGAAALVKSYYPGLSMEKVGELLRVSADNIYGLGSNGSYQYKLGKGRLNVLRALTVSSPSVRILAVAGRDSAGGNNNGAFEPNEDVDLAVTLHNYLDATSAGATATLTTSSSFVTVNSGSFPFGTLASDAEVSNSAAPFQISVLSGMPTSTWVTFVLTITDGAYVDHFEFQVLFNPTYATHDLNNVHVTLTNNGRVGFNDFPDNTQGIGFRYNAQNQLFEGGLMIGYSATKLVNVVRNPSAVQDGDFTSAQLYTLRTPGLVADQDGATAFTDATAPSTNRIGLQVKMASYEFASPPNDNYVILSYDIKNTSGIALANVYAGLFFDWDMVGPANGSEDFDFNRSGYDAARGLGYAYFDTTAPTTYCGAKALTGAAGFRGMRNSASIDLTRAAKYAWMSGGVVQDTGKGDIHFAMSTGPYSIAPNATVTAAFALLAGTGLAELQASADAAQSKWTLMTDVAEEGRGIPEVYALAQNYPNPFNPSTTIRYALPNASAVSLRIYDVLGREVATLVANEEQQAGSHSVRFDARGLASGLYVYELRATARDGNGVTFRDAKKLLLLR